MPLLVAYQNQFKSVHIRGYWLPECNLVCHRDEIQDPVHFCLDSRVRGDDKSGDVLSQSEKLTLSAISSPSMHYQKSWSFILTRMVLGEVLQQDPKILNINRAGKPRLELSQSVVLDRGDGRASDRGSIYFNATGPSNLDAKHRSCNITNGFSVPSSALAQDDAVLHFNVSHSGNLWIIAWSFEHEVGIDVQKIDLSINYQAITRQFFTKSEQAHVNTISDFFDIWTRKEAALKLQGLGFVYMPKILTNIAEFISLDISPEFKAHLAI